MDIVDALGYELGAHWFVAVVIVGAAVMVGRMWHSETWATGDNGLFLGSVAFGSVSTWLVLAALAHQFGFYLTRAFS